MRFWEYFEVGDQGAMDSSSTFDECFELSRLQRLYAFAIW